MNYTTPAEHSFKHRWLPILTGVVLCTVILIIWRELELHEVARQHETVQMESRRVLDLIEVDIRNRVHALERIVNRWEVRGGTPEDEFIADANAYLAGAPGYQAIAWVDESYHIRWVVPFSGNEQTQDLNLALEEDLREALEQARDSDSPSITPPVDLAHGGRGLMVYCPIFEDNEFGGFVLAIIDARKWLTHLLGANETPGMEGDFRTMVSSADTQMFAGHGWSAFGASQWMSTAQAMILGHHFEVRSQATAAFHIRTRSPLPKLVLMVGTLMSLLISLVVLLLQKAGRAAQLAEAGKKVLQAEVVVRHKAEESLATESHRLSNIIGGTNVGTWEWNVPTGETIINERCAEILGYTLDELALISKDPWSDRIHPDDREEGKEQRKRHFRGDSEYYEHEARMKHKDGHWVWVLSTGRVFSWSNYGEPLMMFGTHQDTTKRKQSEEESRARETRMKLLYEITAQASQDIEDQFRQALKASTSLLGMDVGLVSQIPGDEYIIEHCFSKDGVSEPQAVCRLDETYCSLAMAVDETIAIHHMSASEHQHHPCFERTRMESYIGKVIKVRGRTHGTLCFTGMDKRETTFSDIDTWFVGLLAVWVGAAIERREQEHEAMDRNFQLEQLNIQLQRRSEEIESMYHTLGHELKTPLTSAREFIALVHDKVTGPINEEQHECLFNAIESCDAIRRHVDDLVDVSRMETGKFALQMHKVDLVPIFKLIVASKRLEVDTHKIHVGYDGPDTPIIANVDPHRINQVLINLVNNALKFTPFGGTVTLSLTDCPDSSKTVRLSVSDTGRGISPPDLERIFERLYQVKDGDWADEGGMGMGLFLSQQITMLHGSSLHAESQVGQGSLFYFDVPLVDAVEACELTSD